MTSMVPAPNHFRENLPQPFPQACMDQCVPLHKAIIKGNWSDAEDILNKDGNLERSSMTENQETALHIAAMSQSTTFVESLMRKMDPNNFYLLNGDGNTAFCLAVISGNVEMVGTMIENGNRQGLLTTRGSENMMPIYLAALYGNHGMVSYLYDEHQKMASDGLTDNERNKLFLKCIEVDLFDDALKVLNNIAVPQGQYVWEVLHVLAQKPYAFDDTEPHIIWKIISSIFEVFHLKVGPVIKENEATILLRNFLTKIAVKPKNEIDEILKGPMVDQNGTPTYPSRILFVAAAMGNVKLLVELFLIYPDLIWNRNDIKQSIFHVAVSHLHEDVYSLLHEIGSMKDMITPLTDQQGNNMLHLVGMNANKNQPEELMSAPFQMQRKLSCFKDVKTMIPASHREAKNVAGQTPYELFTENHKDLVIKSKKWMKGTINQCMVAAVLIATIGFSVVFQIPGGYNQQTGFPQFLHDGHLLAFVVLDAISFILSSISILMFLSIVVCRYAQTDFFESLPQKLTVGLATLFLSIVTMMAAFGVSFFILFYEKFILIPLIIGSFATISALSYIRLQYPLLVDAFRSRYGSRYLFKSKRHMIYQNPRF